MTNSKWDAPHRIQWSYMHIWRIQRVVEVKHSERHGLSLNSLSIQKLNLGMIQGHLTYRVYLSLYFYNKPISRSRRNKCMDLFLSITCLPDAFMSRLSQECRGSSQKASTRQPVSQHCGHAHHQRRSLSWQHTQHFCCCNSNTQEHDQHYRWERTHSCSARLTHPCLFEPIRVISMCIYSIFYS